MRVVIQRTGHASVTINGICKSAIQKGLMILIGIEETDGKEDIDWLCKKIVNLRVFDDENGVMNKSILDIDGEILVISQFTLHASTKKGNRPSYIRAAKPGATREEVMRAVETAQCREIIDRLPDGLDSVVGNGGTYLSGGENQRIALARAILKDAPIIILDEATAFADAENEHQIQLAFEELTKGKTVLMIAHRLSTIQNADLILVFEEGKIIERGTHDTLLAENGKYASMWKDYQTSIQWKVGKEAE